MGIFKNRDRSYAERFFLFLKPNHDFYDQDLLLRFKELDNSVEDKNKTLEISLKQEIVEIERIIRQRELVKNYQKF